MALTLSEFSWIIDLNFIVEAVKLDSDIGFALNVMLLFCLFPALCDTKLICRLGGGIVGFKGTTSSASGFGPL